MPYRCLSEFLEELDHSGELSRIEEEIDPVLELSVETARLAKDGAALLFTSIKGHDMPVATSLLADEVRIFRTLGVESPDELSGRIDRLLDTSAPEGWFDRIRSGSGSAVAVGVVPRKVRAAACQQIVRLGGDINLNDLPIPQCSPEETNRTIYSAVVLTAEPDSRLPFCGRFDLQQIDSSRLAVCWEAYDEHARLLEEYRARNRKMPLAVVIGGDPVFQLAASAPLPANMDVCSLAGFLRRKPLDAAACRGVDLEVPAEAEIVIEGVVDPMEPPVTVAPMLAPLGHLTRPRSVPAMQVTAVTHRANPIFAAYMPGGTTCETCAIGRAMQHAFLSLPRLSMPELVDFDLPEFAAARHWAAVSINKTYPGQGRRAAHAAWRLRPMQFAKTLIVVDADVDVRDRDQVLAAVAKNFRPELDAITERFPADPYDPIPPAGELTERMAIDATRK